ncbi:hypothetical protein BDQ94DRAFT_140543 [Aspergillus welwitschiae]|uniref:Uncharacterized protein n=1 Tax=Aspergillus welwitschiae TaxID=1341132 RepID=A0A3F3Q7R8_9EURO|nr:hypothetical protein BDQ94DRAFT_140543 [Aspergillus welwitschiae]RDH35274.1 hypothetical protein BDQ94DRAFT_140543 [Aspergillus welwitschiae]
MIFPIHQPFLPRAIIPGVDGLMARPYRQTSGPNQMAVVSFRSSMTDWSTVGSVCLGSEIWSLPHSTVLFPPFPVGRPISDDDDYDSYGHLNIC